MLAHAEMEWSSFKSASRLRALRLLLQKVAKAQRESTFQQESELHQRPNLFIALAVSISIGRLVINRVKSHDLPG